MNDAFDRFTQLLKKTLIPQYCSHPTMGMTPQGFKNNVDQLSLIDINLFLRAWDLGLIRHVGSGNYQLGKANATEKFFWEGRKGDKVRCFSLWLEPIITVAILTRMHVDLGWPISLIGAQSKGDWAFDAVIYKDSHDQAGYVLCEVKKTPVEVEQLAEYMLEYLALPPLPESDIKGARLNAYRKVKALRARRAPFLWLAGPDKYDMAYRLKYDGSQILLETVPLVAMKYER